MSGSVPDDRDPEALDTSCLGVDGANTRASDHIVERCEGELERLVCSKPLSPTVDLSALVLGADVEVGGLQAHKASSFGGELGVMEVLFPPTHKLSAGAGDPTGRDPRERDRLQLHRRRLPAPVGFPPAVEGSILAQATPEVVSMLHVDEALFFGIARIAPSIDLVLVPLVHIAQAEASSVRLEGGPLAPYRGDVADNIIVILHEAITIDGVVGAERTRPEVDLEINEVSARRARPEGGDQLATPCQSGELVFVAVRVGCLDDLEHLARW